MPLLALHSDTRCGKRQLINFLPRRTARQTATSHDVSRITAVHDEAAAGSSSIIITLCTRLLRRQTEDGKEGGGCEFAERNG